MDERAVARARIDSLLDKLSEMTAKVADAEMRATLAEEGAAYSEYRYLECLESKEA